MSLLSVIVPCYNEEESVALFYEELLKNEPFFQEHQIELECIWFPFPEILERRLPCMPDWNIPKAITWL